MPVFTAHPTEAKRRTVLTKLARIAEMLRGLDFERPGPEQERAVHDELREEIVSLWQTEETRAYKPDVMDEVRNGLFYFETALYDLAPEIVRSLEQAVARHYPEARVRPAFLRFGSWMGGDRDGNPFVDAAVTEQALRAHQELALRLLRARHRAAARPPERYRAARRGRRARRQPRGRTRPCSRTRRAARRSATATSRTGRSCSTSTASSGPRSRRAAGRGARTTAAARHLRGRGRALSDLRLLQRSLRPHRGERLADGRLGTLVRQAEIFGFHLATLDLRQHSARHSRGHRRGARALRQRGGLSPTRPKTSAPALLTGEILCRRARSPRTGSTSRRRRTRRSSCSGWSGAPTSASAARRSRAT